MCRNESVIGQENLVTGLNKRIFLFRSLRDEPAMTDRTAEGIFEGIGN